MEDMPKDLDEKRETISTHISVACTKFLRERYRTLSRKLEIHPNGDRRKVLTQRARAALQKVVENMEKDLAE